MMNGNVREDFKAEKTIINVQVIFQGEVGQAPIFILPT